MFATTSLIFLSCVAVFASAVSVGSCLRSLQLVQEIRSLRSLQGEIAEIDVSVGSLIKTIRRIEGRQTATISRASSNGSGGPKVTTQPIPPSLMDKDQLRRYAGLLPGVAPAHSKDQENGNNDGDPA